MPPDAPALAALAARLDAELAAAEPQRIVAAALATPQIGPLALVSSFGAESVVLLHLVAQVDRGLPVIFIDTEMLFPETLAYQAEVAATLGLRDLRRVRPDPGHADPDATLHRTDPDACCTLRKVIPLERALGPFGGWITGRKRFHGGDRATLPVVEAEAGRIKLNPLARWPPDRVAAYLDAQRLPRHPLATRGYASIGCAPCTSTVASGEEVRAGRWRGQPKVECGIHVAGGRVLRGAPL